MIKVENVSFKYKNSKDKVLENINFSVNDGEVIAIVGENGSGKSTIGKLISGVTKLKEGQILIDDLDISKSKNKELLQEKIGIVFQNPENQIIFNNINDELSFSLKELSKEEKERRIEEALKQVEMHNYKDKDLYTLSLGQKQRVVIAEILAKKPKYIILDEPTTMIDSHGKEKIYEIIKKLKDQGFTIICITNLADEMLLADKTLILYKGKIVEEIQKKDLVKKSNELEKYGITIPTILKIIKKLEKENIKFNFENFTIDEFVGVIKNKIDEKC